MAAIEFGQDGVQVDAGILARAFGITPDALQRAMRDGAITSRFERGEDEDAGRFRLTFQSSARRVRLIVDGAGTVLTTSTVDFTPRQPDPTPGA